MKVTVRSPCRLHLSLIDLNGSLGRIDGSVGITLANPHVEVTAEKSSKQEVDAGVRTNEIRQLISKISTKYGITKKIKLNARRQIPLHAGLGSTTQLYLSVARAMLGLNNIKANVRELAVLTGRGGTSGIGVHAFEHGGFLVDCGHSYGKGKDKTGILPSSYSKARPAPLACRLEFPDWHTIVCIPPEKGLHGKQERDYFTSKFPASESEAERISRIILMKMIPAVAEQNLEEFDKSIKLLNQARSFKLKKETQKIIQGVNKKGGKATSISSFGPAVFTFTQNHQTAEKIMHQLADYGYVTITRAQNHGATVRRM